MRERRSSKRDSLPLFKKNIKAYCDCPTTNLEDPLRHVVNEEMLLFFLQLKSLQLQQSRHFVLICIGFMNLPAYGLQPGRHGWSC